MKRIATLSIFFAALIEFAIERARFDLWIVAVVAIVTLLWNVVGRTLRPDVNSKKHDHNASASRRTVKNGEAAMTQREIRVGIVGANAHKSWANVSHLPAINGLPGLKLAAVATSNEQSAREAAEAFGADRCFSDPFAMIANDEIDIITISVKVPAHRELVLAALEAGRIRVNCKS